MSSLSGKIQIYSNTKFSFLYFPVSNSSYIRPSLSVSSSFFLDKLHQTLQTAQTSSSGHLVSEILNIIGNYFFEQHLTSEAITILKAAMQIDCGHSEAKCDAAVILSEAFYATNKFDKTSKSLNDQFQLTEHFG